MERRDGTCGGYAETDQTLALWGSRRLRHDMRSYTGWQTPGLPRARYPTATDGWNLIDKCHFSN